MPTIQETLAALREATQRGAARRYKDVRAELSAAQQQLAGEIDSAALLGITTALQAATEGLKEEEQWGGQAETTLGQLSEVFVHYGQLGEELFPQEVKSGKEAEAPTPSFLIDLKSGTIVEGTIRGKLPPGRATEIIELVAGAEHPVPMRDASRVLYPKSPIETASSTIRPLIAKTNLRAEAQGLPRPISFSQEGGGYVLEDSFEVLGVRRRFDPKSFVVEALPAVTPPEEIGAQRPMTHPISDIVKHLEDKGVDGITDVRVRRLTHGLMASGRMRPGEHLLEKAAGDRILIEFTDVGRDRLRELYQHFGGQGKLYVTTAERWLDEQDRERLTELAGEQPPRRYLISQLAHATRVNREEIDQMVESGRLKEGRHFFLIGNNRRVFEPKAVEKILALKRKERASKRPEGQEDEWQNPYGKNGPVAVNGDYPELVLTQRMLDALPTIESVTGQPVQEAFRLELANRAGELAEKLGIGMLGAGIPDDELPAFSGDRAQEIRRGVAATMAHIVHSAEAKKEPIELRFIEKKRPGVAFAHTALRDLVRAGQSDLALKLAQSVAEGDHKTYLVSGDGIVNPVIE